MRKKVLSMILSVTMMFTGLGANMVIAPNGKTAEAAENSIESAYCWDFENQVDKKFTNVGTAAEGDAVLCGTAGTEEDAISIGGKNYKKEDNKVLVLSRRFKGELLC